MKDILMIRGQRYINRANAALSKMLEDMQRSKAITAEKIKELEDGLTENAPANPGVGADPLPVGPQSPAGGHPFKVIDGGRNAD